MTARKSGKQGSFLWSNLVREASVDKFQFVPVSSQGSFVCVSGVVMGRTRDRGQQGDRTKIAERLTVSSVRPLRTPTEKG